MKYPYSRPDVTDADRAAVQRVLHGSMLTRGEETRLFEEELCARFSVKHAIVCNNGTAALHMAYLAVGLTDQQCLVTSPLTFLATANAAKMVGADVAFTDVDVATGLMTPETLNAALLRTDKPVGVITPVHLAGRACDMPAIREIADKHGCRVVEDAAHAPGAVYTDQSGNQDKVGACAHSDALILSFHAIKHIAMGEGGAMLTNDDGIAERARLVRNHGMTRNSEDWQYAPEPDAPWYYEMQSLGWNYHCPDILCALGRSQLQRLDNGIEARDEIAALYNHNLLDVEMLGLPSPVPAGWRHAWHLYPIAVDFAALNVSRSSVMRQLGEAGVGTQVHYIPLYHHPFYRNVEVSLPGVETYYEKTLSIPMYPGLNDDDVLNISKAIKSVLRNPEGR